VKDLRNANKLRRRQQILQGAHDLIARRGVQALTMRSLAEESSVSVPTIYALVGGRHDVIAALMDSAVHRFDAGVAAIDSRGLFRATAIVELFADILDHERDLLHALLASGALVAAGSEPPLLFHRRQVELERALLEAVEDGELRADVDPVFAATTAVRLGMGVIIDWVIQAGDPTDLRVELLRSISVVIAAFS
jgi:AcrR family transcriptional regulator